MYDIKLVFPGGTNKALTLSYDDGVEQDIRLIELLDRYGLRGTFNLNPGLQDENKTFQKTDITVKHLNLADLPKVYANHEVAGHTNTHVFLEKMDIPQMREEVVRCQDTLAQLFGREIYGMAYPYGTYDDRVVQVLKAEGIRYSRTCIQTENFELSNNLLLLETTCRHANPNLLKLAEDFVQLKPDKPQLFYLWGHSYEFDEFRNWDLIEEFCKIISGHDDVFYGTNSEVLLGLKQI